MKDIVYIIVFAHLVESRAAGMDSKTAYGWREIDLLASALEWQFSAAIAFVSVVKRSDFCGC